MDWDPVVKMVGVRLFSAVNVFVYRLTGGRVTGRMGRAPILLLTATGRRTGKRRTTPVLYLRDGEALVIVASKGGSPRHPAWFLNLQANPVVDVEIGRERRTLRAREATAEERERLWPRLLDIYPPWEKYQQRTTRRIPVVLLEPL